MQKGKTKLAIYGLGNIRDERLHRMFFQKKGTKSRARYFLIWYDTNEEYS